MFSETVHWVVDIIVITSVVYIVQRVIRHDIVNWKQKLPGEK